MKMTDNTELLHQQYLHHLRKEKRLVRLYQIIILFAFFALWEVASRYHWINPLIFSSPSKIWKLFISKLQDGSLYLHTGVTVYETMLGFILGTLLGAILAGILWWSPKLSKILDPYLVVFNAMPKVAFGPMLIVIFGTGLNSSIAMGIIISVIVTTIVIYTAFRDVDPNYIKVLQTFGASRGQKFKEAILPATFPTIISTLKVNVGLSWVGVIVGEYLVASKGLGYLIIYGFQVFNFTLVMLSLMIVAVIATIMYQLVAILEKKLVKKDS
ncbi:MULTISPECIES: ABC transporter permease [Heyndrickxia]|uniref:ABC transporter permease n=1 Tax=Heyndrickxia sporothermodurans TaxID=46224 RepID=A0AB37HEQ6_9BACI|nr:ABC transporter permease [Heyndrickxia sporothermodurans]MBL5767955.1 ABC transporter permease [Heyndrickxia sporothermodurans]MBL5771500.1 ABC transporter permease [Heyndrickxia sporothermodurans]MBL5775248.1 ABC transporter permease [Heyndrickxia sporothermodurans]MBL5778647.1 ABC transporter permease [Heyndrickxia sporothermodurans]MBL5781897.1 ABC transporter permease [Heyndrickxia sporothermodurans]